MEIHKMTLHLVSWCQTCMAHFLKSCHVFDGILAAIYDVMYTKVICVDEQDLLFSVMNVYILKIISDLQPKLEETFLCQADKMDLLVTRVFDMSDSFASPLESLTTASSDAFQDLLHFDQNANLLGTTKCSGNVHTIMQNHWHQPSCHVTAWTFGESKNWTYCCPRKDLNQYHLKCERSMGHWNILLFMVRPWPLVEIISTWENNSRT